MANDVRTIPQIRKITYTTYANFPTTALTGDLAYASDRLVLYRWSGAAWQAITIHSSSGLAAAIPAAADLPAGSLYYETDTQLTKQVAGGAWQTISSKYIEGARVYHNIDQTIANDTWTYLAFNSERYDNDTIHDTVTNNSRLTCQTAGKYLIIGQVQFNTDPDGIRNIQFRLNGTTVILNQSEAATPTLQKESNASTIYDLAVGDYIELGVHHTAGAALDIKYVANHTPEFMMQRIG
jgi:uncharacterized protein YhdP